MTIDEAIAKYKEITNTDANCPAHCNISCDKCVQESEQLAEWLEDYKRIKMLIPIEQALKAEYNKAIDDFAKLPKENENVRVTVWTGIERIGFRQYGKWYTYTSEGIGEATVVAWQPTEPFKERD